MESPCVNSLVNPEFSSQIVPQTGEIRLISRIKKFFDPELLLELRVLSMNFDLDNNQKIEVAMQILKKYGMKATPLGGGTNRLAVMLDGYAAKVALDVDGRVDNKREFIYSQVLQPYAIKAYEVTGDGLISFFEYVIKFKLEDLNSVNKARIAAMLDELSSQFLIGDVSIDPKNYANLGYRESDGRIVILDFAYIYNLTYRLFKCKCGGLINYDKEDFVHLRCAECGKIYTFWDIRQKVSRKMEEEEIGDIYQRGYNVTEAMQVVKIDPRFTDTGDDRKKKKKEKPKIEKQKKFRGYKDENEQPTLEESIREFRELLKKEESENEQEENEIVL